MYSCTPAMIASSAASTNTARVKRLTGFTRAAADAVMVPPSELGGSRRRFYRSKFTKGIRKHSVGPPAALARPAPAGGLTLCLRENFLFMLHSRLMLGLGQVLVVVIVLAASLAPVGGALAQNPGVAVITSPLDGA